MPASTSSAVTGRPTIVRRARRGRRAATDAITALNGHEQRRRRRARPGAASSTVWPSDSSETRRVVDRGDALGVDVGQRRAGAARAHADAQRAGFARRPRPRTDARAAARCTSRRSCSPASTSSVAALSRTLRVTHVAHARARPTPRASSGPSETRPRRRLQPEEPAHARGDADRTAAVARVRRPAPCPLATAAAVPPLEPPGVARGVPRVVRGPVRLRLGRRHQPELGCVRLADDDEPRGFELLEEVARDRRAT